MIDREHDLPVTKQAKILRIAVAASTTGRVRFWRPTWR